MSNLQKFDLQKPVIYHERLGMVGTQVYRQVDKKSPAVESSTWPLNSHNCSENYPEKKN